MSGSFIAAFMVLYDFKADFLELWDVIINIKDYILKLIIKIYSSLISSNVSEPSNSNSPNKEIPKRKSLLEQMVGSRSDPSVENNTTHKSLRNENGYKNTLSDSNSETPLYKDWRVWACGAVIVVSAGVVLYLYMNGIYPFGGSDPGSPTSSNNEVINSPFGPTVGPLAESNTNTNISSTSPTSPISTSSSSSTDSNATAKGPSILTSEQRNIMHTYPPSAWDSPLNFGSKKPKSNVPSQANVPSQPKDIDIDEYNWYFR